MKTTLSIHPTAYVSPKSYLAGDVTVGAHCSIWPFASLRGDHAPISLGEGTNVQDSCTLHVSVDRPVRIGSQCTIGHGAVVHGATVGDTCIIGMNATVLDGAVIGNNSIVGAGALVTEGKVFPDNSLILGVPAKAVKTLPPASVDAIRENAASYRELARHYREME
ncbi:MAG: gamma carbonic anhydrase family protein [Candidatus Methanofastidiosa archaeon]|nr:gamma carbonic anhydrase family protein [Candidatus Methanofastidiosa archaeon]